MRPLSLVLEGFTAFKDPVEIDFGGLHLFAVTGPNGAGKSSLLEAILIALFGDAPRMKGRSFKDFISQNRSEFRIALVFLVDDQIYRVQRRYPRKGLPQVRLEIQKENDLWKTLTDKVKETDRVITTLLKMGYDTFTKSVLLPQNLFGQLLEGDKENRREVLGEILSLKLYEQISSLAGERSRILKERLRQDDLLLKELLAKTQAADFETLRDELENSRVQSLVFIEKKEKLTQNLHDLTRVTEKENHLGLLDLQITEISGMISKSTQECAKFEKEIAENTRQAEHEVPKLKQESAALLSIRDTAVRHQKLIDEETFHQRRLALINKKTKEIEAVLIRLCQAHEERLKEKIEQDALREELQKKDRRFDLLHDQAEKLRELDSLESEKSKLNDQFDSLEKEISELRTLFDEILSEGKRVERAIEGYKKDNDEIRKKTAAAKLREGLVLGEACPVCIQEVSKIPSSRDPISREHDLDPIEEERKKLIHREGHLQGSLSQKAQEAEANRRRLEVVLNRVRLLGHELSQTLGHSAGEVVIKARQEYKELRENRGILRKLWAALERLSSELQHWKDEISQKRQEFALFEKEKSTLVPVLERLSAERKEIEAKPASIGLSFQSPDSIEERLVEVEKQIARWSEKKERLSQNSHQQRARLLSLTDERERLTLQRSKESDDFEKLRKKVFPTKQGVKELKFSERANKIKDELRMVEKELASNQLRTGKMNQQLEDLEASRAKFKAIEDRRKETQQEEILCATLHQDFQRNKLPDFLFSSLLTQLLEMAGEKFRQFSGGRYQLALEGTGEIQVLDGWGADLPRPVESLSGGEMFAASLALALALSDYLQGRQKIECLFIDEGFGSLDLETRDKVAEILSSLEHEEKLIGIVTHIEELAELFPERIRIEKWPESSRVIQERDVEVRDAGRISEVVA